MAEAAWTAHAQGKFWQLHDRLFSRNVPRTRASLEQDAAEIGLRLDDFRTALDEGRYRNKVLEDADLLAQAALTSRPLFVVNGRRADSRIALVQLVETALKKAGIRPPLFPATPDAVIRPPVDASTPQWFHFEARDEGWAARVERALAGIAQRDLRAVDPAVEAVAVDCKSRVCRLRFRSGKERHAANFVKQVYGAEVLPARAGVDDQAYL